MIYTSYFGKLKKLPGNCVPIAICQYPPKWYEGLVYHELAPSPSILFEYKKDPDSAHAEAVYNERFMKEILIHSPYKFIANMVAMLPNDKKDILNKSEEMVWESKDVHIVMLCFEKNGDFCHRSLVAEWLRENGIPCEEFCEAKEKDETKERKEVAER